MKKFIALTSATALSVTALLGGITAFAGPVTKVDTEANITFVANEDEETVVIAPDGSPDVDIPAIVGPDGETNTGPLTIAFAPTLNFGQQAISNHDARYYMIPETFKEVDGEEYLPVAAFAQVQDTRGTNAGWILSVTASEFTSDTQNNVLKGAEISFLNSWLDYPGDEENAPTISSTTIKLSPGEPTTILEAGNGQGAGASSIVWGTQEAIDNHEEGLNTDVELFVPGTTAQDATTYTATLTWELIAGVINE